MKKALALCALLFCLAPAAFGDVLKDGLKADEAGDCDLAIELLSQAIICRNYDDRQLGLAYARRGFWYTEKDLNVDALLDLSMAIQLDPKQGEVYLARAELYHELAYYALEISDLKQAAKLLPNEPVVYDELADAWYASWEEMQASCSETGVKAAGQLEEALLNARKYAELAPDDPEAMERVDGIKGKLGREE